MTGAATRAISTIPEPVIPMQEMGGSAGTTSNIYDFSDEAVLRLDVPGIVVASEGIDEPDYAVFGNAPAGHMLIPMLLGRSEPLRGNLISINAPTVVKGTVIGRPVLLSGAEVANMDSLRVLKPESLRFFKLTSMHLMKAENVIALSKEALTPLSELVVYYRSHTEPRSVRDSLIARFRLLRHLPENHDNEGASAAEATSVDAAIAFINKMTTSTPCSATLNDEGLAVIEFEDRSSGLFADVTFLPKGRVEIYRRKPGAESILFEDQLTSVKLREFLANEIDVVF